MLPGGVWSLPLLEVFGQAAWQGYGRDRQDHENLEPLNRVVRASWSKSSSLGHQSSGSLGAPHLPPGLLSLVEYPSFPTGPPASPGS